MKIILNGDIRHAEQALICAQVFIRDYADKKKVGDGCAYGTDYHGDFFVMKTKTGVSVTHQAKA